MRLERACRYWVVDMFGNHQMERGVWLETADELRVGFASMLLNGCARSIPPRMVADIRDHNRGDNRGCDDNGGGNDASVCTEQCDHRHMPLPRAPGRVRA